MRYGSLVPFEIKSSIRMPVYPSDRSIVKAGSPFTHSAALMPAMIPWHAASS